MLKQYVLFEADSCSEMLCWLDDPRLKHGSLVTLKEIPDRVWQVTEIYDRTLDRKDIKRGWNNNI